MSSTLQRYESVNEENVNFGLYIYQCMYLCTVEKIERRTGKFKTLTPHVIKSTHYNNYTNYIIIFVFLFFNVQFLLVTCVLCLSEI